MAISGTDWSSATDPFILATAHVQNYASTGGFEIVFVNDAEGYINGILDKDVQELYWSKDGAPDVTWPVVSIRTKQSLTDDKREFGFFDEDRGTGFKRWYQYEVIYPSPSQLSISFLGKSGGAVPYSLFAFTAFAWEQKDPAQIIFSWIAHHVDSIWTLKNYLDQTTFQDASDYYDENPCPLSLWREVGQSIDAQMKKVLNHTSDVLVIGPQDTTGDVLLGIKTKRSGLTSRTTAIDLTGESVRSYTIRPTDRYTVDRISAPYGRILLQEYPFLAEESSWIMPPVEYPSENRTVSVQKVGTLEADRTIEIECPYHLKRRNLLSHLDIGFWKDDQDEIEVEFADLSHFNFEAGDIVPVTGQGYDGTELFLVTEKTVDWDTMLATCRLLMLRGIDGKSPVYTDEANLLLSLQPNSLGLFFDGDVTLPADTPIPDWSRNFDRLWSHAGYSHATKHTRGNVGPGGGVPPGPWSLEANKRERWPAFELGTDTGLEISQNTFEGRDGIDSGGGANYTFYWVGNPDNIGIYSTLFDMDDGGTDTVAFSVSGPGGGIGKVQFYDGTWRGTKSSITGWQILVFSLHTAGSRIRRNGADLENSIPYTIRAMSPLDDYGIGVNAAGTSGVFSGDWGECALFKAAHGTSQIESIEAHLAEKYGITI